MKSIGLGNFDVLVSIFKYLDTKSKGRAARVCTSWNEAVNCRKLWEKDEATLCSRHLNEETKRSIVSRNIRRFNLRDFEPKVNEFLRAFSGLEYLRLSDCKIKEGLYDFLQIVTNVKCLHVTCNSYVLDELLGMVTYRLPSLQPLILPEEDTRDEGALTCLQELHLSHVIFSEEEIFDFISQKFANLVTLNLVNCTIASDEGFLYLSLMKKLECLSLAFSAGYLTDEQLRYVCQITSLKSLDLTSCNLISERGFRSIPRLTSLTSLNLTGCLMIADVDDIFNYIGRLPSLLDLNLHGCKISDAGLYHLTANGLKLTKLRLSCCSRINDEGLLYICRSSFDLHDLSLSYSKVTDDGISHIVQRFPNLHYLGLTSCRNVTDKSVSLIKKNLKKLRYLHANKIGKKYN